MQVQNRKSGEGKTLRSQIFKNPTAHFLTRQVSLKSDCFRGKVVKRIPTSRHRIIRNCSFKSHGTLKETAQQIISMLKNKEHDELNSLVKKKLKNG